MLTLWYLLSANTIVAFTHADTLRGSDGPGRKWWKVIHYDLTVQINEQRYIVGQNKIKFRVLSTAPDSMQIDLDTSFGKVQVKAAENENIELSREGKVLWLRYPFHNWAVGSVHEITIFYRGVPREAVHPPWDGGFSWGNDKVGKPWIAVSCQGLGASAWWPCKDAQWDEPDSGMDTHFALSGFKAMADSMVVVGNGRSGGDGNYEIQQSNPGAGEKVKFWNWHVVNPINNYDVTFYAGDYVHWHDTLMGEKGKLDLDFWALRYNEDKARKQFAVVKQMIHCFEYWMGPYPFYEDGYKLVEAPYLGMEHQSAIAYGNDYKMGYKGYDRTYTGIGMNFDYIIVHESGHEWFGNSITARDIADNWVHEGITTYSETLFAECLLGKEKADKYNVGEWRNIENDKPIIGPYGVNQEGSNDMYDKGTAMMHMIRILTNDDEKFRMMLRGLSKDFYHQTVASRQIENYIAAHTGLDLTSFFNQYLRTSQEPVIQYYLKHKQLFFRFNDTVPGLKLPVTFMGGKKSANVTVTNDWQHIKWKHGYNIKLAPGMLVRLQ